MEKRNAVMHKLKNWLITLALIGAAWMLCAWLQPISSGDAAATEVYVPLVFVLAVLGISLLTDGYIYGIVASLVSVLGVNWAFTYPYMEFNFSIYGYPVTFVVMLAVSFAVSTLVSLVRKQEKLRRESEQEKLRANLLRAISHDLRTPLTSIIGSVSAVMEQEQLSVGERNRLLSDARDDAEWLIRMVENLLSITRISGAEKTELHRSPELLEEIIGECAAKFKKRDPTVGLSVRVPDEPVTVEVDAMLIEQVLMNLMDNAVHHGEKTTHIYVEAYRDNGFVFVGVSDDGVGIAQENLPKLFEGQTEPSDSNRFRGIGLQVCRAIVEAHGGRIRAKNNVGGGAKFEFSLPMSKEEEL